MDLENFVAAEVDSSNHTGELLTALSYKCQWFSSYLGHLKNADTKNCFNNCRPIRISQKKLWFVHIIRFSSFMHEVKSRCHKELWDLCFTITDLTDCCALYKRNLKQPTPWLNSNGQLVILVREEFSALLTIVPLYRDTNPRLKRFSPFSFQVLVTTRHWPTTICRSPTRIW